MYIEYEIIFCIIFFIRNNTCSVIVHSSLHSITFKKLKLVLLTHAQVLPNTRVFSGHFSTQNNIDYVIWIASKYLPIKMAKRDMKIANKKNDWRNVKSKEVAAVPRDEDISR